MKDTDLYSRILGLSDPWFVADVALNTAGDRVDGSGPRRGDRRRDSRSRSGDTTTLGKTLKAAEDMRAQLGFGTPRGWADAWLVAIWTEQKPTVVCLGLLRCLENQSCLILPLALISSRD